MFYTSTLRSIATAGALTAVVLTASGCGAIIERATEEAVEKIVEEAIEADTGGDVDIEFNDDAITVEASGEDGDIRFSVDQNGVQIDGTDADGNDFSVDGDEDGFEVDGTNGEVFDIDSDGTFTATDEDGSVTTGEATEDGGFTVEGADGESVFTSGPGIPEEWPNDVPKPSGLIDPQGIHIDTGEQVNIMVTGQIDGDVDEIFNSYVSELEGAGFTEESTFTQAGELASGSFVNGDRTVNASVSSNGRTNEMVVATN
ncbi:MAG: hypothetical protein ACJAXA_001670 [Candidatus Aldehydirespiratoraceae bacterium]|jgi:hypothetical protein